MPFSKGWHEGRYHSCFPQLQKVFFRWSRFCLTPKNGMKPFLFSLEHVLKLLPSDISDWRFGVQLAGCRDLGNPLLALLVSKDWNYPGFVNWMKKHCLHTLSFPPRYSSCAILFNNICTSQLWCGASVSLYRHQYSASFVYSVWLEQFFQRLLLVMSIE